MSKMQEEPWYLQEKIVQGYESYYETKYRRADLLEKKLLKNLLEQLGPAQNLLEVGCGTGHFTRWMKTLELECYGLDLSHLMLKEAKRLWVDGPLLQGESNHLPFKAKSFDVVAFIACLEYMPDIAAVLTEAARVARKGIMIGLMNKWSPPTIRRIVQVKMGKNPYYKNARFYSISDMKHILRETFGDRYAIVYWTTTVFARIFGSKESAMFPFGSFLGMAVKLGDVNDRYI
jgi:ubiquinone/menaquinone biosynthesis C-methylase UbiE